MNMQRIRNDLTLMNSTSLVFVIELCTYKLIWMNVWNQIQIPAPFMPHTKYHSSHISISSCEWYYYWDTTAPLYIIAKNKENRSNSHANNNSKNNEKLINFDQSTINMNIMRSFKNSILILYFLHYYSQ